MTGYRTGDSTVSDHTADLSAEYLDWLAQHVVDTGALTVAARTSEFLPASWERFLPTPVFLTAAERRQLVSDLRQIYDLLLSLPDRLFDGEYSQLAAAVGLNPLQADLVRRAADARHGSSLPPLGRSDLYRTPSGFKLLEFNITSALGGFETAYLNRAMLEHSALTDFVAGRRLEYGDILAAIVATLRTECSQHLTGPRPVIALVDSPASFPTYRTRLQLLSKYLDAWGFRAVPCHAGQLRATGGRLWLDDGSPVQVVWRFFMLEEVTTEAELSPIEPVLAAAERNEVGLFRGFDTEMYGNKGALALLSSEAFRAVCQPAELACIDRFLPWTRTVLPTTTTPAGETVELLDYARAKQHDLILKPTMQHSGVGIVPGWHVSAQAWQAAIVEATGTPYIIQERVRPLPEPFPHELEAGQVEYRYLNWGVYLSDPAITGGDGYAGCLVRATGDSNVGILSLGAGASLGCGFTE